MTTESIPKTESNPLQEATIAALVTELMSRGKLVEEQARFLTAKSAEIFLHVEEFDQRSKSAIAACEDLTKRTVHAAKQELADLIGMSKHQLKIAAETSRKECQTLTTGLLERVEALEKECLRRVEAAEAKCQSTVETVTAEYNRRADAAEEESLRCIEQADRATQAADALGSSFNRLNDRVHGIEVMFRTLMGGGAASTPVYTPTVAPQAAPPPPAPPSPPVPVVAPSPSQSSNGRGPAPRRRPEMPSMEFVLIGLHHKDEAHIRTKLPAHIARAAVLNVIENTMKELLPKSADYCLVGGDHDMAIRWKFCMDHYGSAKCVRLENNSVATFRAKIEELYTARYPLRAPANLTAVGNVLAQVEAARFVQGKA